MTACSGNDTKPLPPGEVEKQYPPAALVQKEARPEYQPGREWAYIPEYAAELEAVVSRYECKLDRLAAWSQGKDPATVECQAQ